MTRHILDEVRSRSASQRVRNFVARDRSDGPHPARAALFRAMRTGGASRRLREFLRIERTRDA